MAFRSGRPAWKRLARHSCGLNRWNKGQLTIYREHSAPTITGVREIVGSGLPDKGLVSLFEDSRGRIWVSTLRGFGYMENDRFVSIKGIPGGNVLSIVQATFKTIVEGSVRKLHPLVQEESYCIGREAIINALTHSGGRNVDVEIIYESRQFRLHVRDDGHGIDLKILEEGGSS